MKPMKAKPLALTCYLALGVAGGAMAQAPAGSITDVETRSWGQENIVIPPERRFVEPKAEETVEVAAEVGKTNATVDERPLWNLLDQKRYRELRAQITRRQRDNPGWRPPAKLLYWLEQNELQARIDAALRKTSDAEILALARRYPNSFNCDNPHLLWAVGEALSRSGDVEQAYGVYNRTLERCARNDNWAVTVQKARDVLPADRFAALLDRHVPPTPFDAPGRVAADTRYAFFFARYLDARATDHAAAQPYLDRISTQIEDKRDAAAARTAAWDYYGVQNYVEAEVWFSRAYAWENDEESAYGLVLTRIHQGRWADAEALAQQFGADNPRMQAALGQGMIGRATAAYDQKRFDESLNLLRRAEQTAPLPRSGSLLRAWIYFDTERYADAAPRFAQLYRAEPDESSAQGVYYSYLQLNQTEPIAELAASTPGPLTPLWDDFKRKRLLSHKRLHAAYRADPGIDPALANVDTPNILLGDLERWRDGDSGLGKLHLSKTPVAEGVVFVEKLHRLSVRVDNVKLDSGTLPANAVIGAYPETTQDYSFTPQDQLDAGIEPTLAYIYEGWTRFYLEFGSTPQDGTVSAALTGRSGFTARNEAGWLNAELYAQPIRESMLSYVGTVDPYEGIEWGRVVETGAAVGGYYKLQKRWGIYGRLGYASLDGVDVADNEVLRATASLGKDLGGKRFDYFSVGPYVDYSSYADNLSHFTIGHGGYFSPQSLYTVGLGLDALTREGRNYIAALQAQIGYQDHHEDAAPFFPLAPDGREYDENDESGLAGRLSFKGVVRITGHWQVGGGIEYQDTPEYQETAAMLFARWNWDSRPAVFSYDLPDYMFSAVR